MATPARSSSKPVQPENILDAFESLLLEVGPRHATLDAVAKRVHLTRSGVLHHYRSRQALIEALIARLSDRVEADIAQLREHLDSPLEFYIRSSLDVDAPVERTIAAVSKLATANEAEAKSALRSSRAAWLEALQQCVPDTSVVKLAMFIGDGMSYNVEMSETTEADDFVSPTSVEAVLRLLGNLQGQSS